MNMQVNLRRLKLIFLCLVLVFSLYLSLTEKIFAAFDLSVTPYEGGFDLRFGVVKSAAKASKEVTVRITSDIATQYRIIQTYIPLTDSRGFTIPTQAVRVYTLRGSNTAGTLGYDMESWVSAGPMVLYTSDSSGRSDSFVVVYGLDVPENQEPGLYRGRLIFSLEPIGSSQSPVTKTLDVTVEVESAANFEVSTSSGSKVLKLESSPDTKENTQEVQIKINGFLGSQYRIIQKLSTPLRDTAGKLLPEDTILMSARGGGQGKLGISGISSLPYSDVVLYASDSRGSPDDVTITYTFNDKDLNAGIYRGALTYLVESSVPLKQGGVLEILQLEVEIKPIFNLIVTTDYAGSIVFKDLKPGKPPQICASYIEVQTNTDRPYQVIQKVANLLTSQEGKTIPYGFFKLKTESEGFVESLGYPTEAPVEVGQMTLFTSKDGKPATFKVIYKLDTPADIHSGNYSTGIIYSLLEM